ncbi:MAG: hypothetical protein IPO77_12105 [Acidobacteria bacterium]|nr:hypothetical protein [Acidobacteriota bacterium]
MRSRTSAKSFSLAVMITVAIAMGACSSGQPSQPQLNANASPTPAADFATPPQTQIGGTTAPQQSPGQAPAPGTTQSQPQASGSGGQSNSAPPSSGSTAANMAPRPVATPAPPRVYTIPSGTVISVTTSSDLTTKEDRSGQKFTASLNNSIVDGDWVIAKKGAPVEGVIVTSDPGGKVKGTASISVRVERLTLADGRQIEFPTNTYAKAAKTTKKKDAIKVGIGAGIGAAIGAIAGGGKGAAIGAGAGGAAGTGYVLGTKGDPAVIPAESNLSFRLTTPVKVTKR